MTILTTVSINNKLLNVEFNQLNFDIESIKDFWTDELVPVSYSTSEEIRRILQDD